MLTLFGRLALDSKLVIRKRWIVIQLFSLPDNLFALVTMGKAHFTRSFLSCTGMILQNLSHICFDCQVWPLCEVFQNDAKVGWGLERAPALSDKNKSSTEVSKGSRNYSQKHALNCWQVNLQFRSLNLEFQCNIFRQNVGAILG